MTRVRVKSMTLVEVIAALAILGGSVTAILVAQARSLNHMKVCGLELTGKDLAGELIVAWRLQNEDVRVASKGEIEGAPGWSWSRSARQVAVVHGVFMMEITLDMSYHGVQEHEAPWVRSYRWLVREKRE